ncbi:hypothetical protein ACFP81_10790 [Deinococcus lacus]|uniref:Uncharacterized protein n=1 Tax=Deinococcus lacus TaxID=392561 RepID=A0ABW1YFV0_9DEIO
MQNDVAFAGLIVDMLGVPGLGSASPFITSDIKMFVSGQKAAQTAINFDNLANLDQDTPETTSQITQALSGVAGLRASAMDTMGSLNTPLKDSWVALKKQTIEATAPALGKAFAKFAVKNMSPLRAIDLAVGLGKLAYIAHARNSPPKTGVVKFERCSPKPEVSVGSKQFGKSAATCNYYPGGSLGSGEKTILCASVRYGNPANVRWVAQLGKVGELYYDESTAYAVYTAPINHGGSLSDTITATLKEPNELPVSDSDKRYIGGIIASAGFSTSGPNGYCASSTSSDTGKQVHLCYYIGGDFSGQGARVYSKSLGVDVIVPGVKDTYISKGVIALQLPKLPCGKTYYSRVEDLTVESVAAPEITSKAILYHGVQACP